ncbi:hypothetical protein ACFQMA_16290 [Halosimplex aquaticum]|uniref:Uncharacterized protein n=1 Tax=Halosimplex aquaticum TaxID=3026162 RepID=A0ABD5YAP8_9EURY|nr:hypothetical protein [Halosimplex aquaticum]
MRDDALLVRLNAILALSVLAVSLLLGLVLGETRQTELFVAIGSLLVFAALAVVAAMGRSNRTEPPDGQ